MAVTQDSSTEGHRPHPARRTERTGKDWTTAPGGGKRQCWVRCPRGAVICLGSSENKELMSTETKYVRQNRTEAEGKVALEGQRRAGQNSRWAGHLPSAPALAPPPGRNHQHRLRRADIQLNIYTAPGTTCQTFYRINFQNPQKVLSSSPQGSGVPVLARES